MKTFKDYLVEFDTPTIYCDMDGVLADFVSFTTKHLGKPFKDEDWLKPVSYTHLTLPTKA